MSEKESGTSRQKGAGMDSVGISSAITDELVGGITGALGSVVTEIILYGSVARGTAEHDSDVDIALLTRRPLSAEEEDRLSDVIVDLDLKYDKVFSVIDIAGAEFRTWLNVIPFYKNVANEGVVLWTAA